MDVETYGCVKRFCNLGDTLDGGGGADLAATGRIKKWMDEVPGAFAIQSTRDERSSVCQFCKSVKEQRCR